MQFISSVVQFSTSDGREDGFKTTISDLEKCQKALNEYLERKKKLFPRFYFMSNVALLDVLSNGNDPPMVLPHLGAIYDGIGDLKMLYLAEGRRKSQVLAALAAGEDEEKTNADTRSVVTKRNSKTALAMISKDKEVVDFHEPFECQ